MQAERRRWSPGFALRGGELAGAGRNGAPGLGLACGLAGEGLRGARDPLVGSARCDGDRAWLRDGDGWTGRRGTPEHGVQGSGRTYQSWQLAQKEEKGVLRLTEVWIEGRVRRRGSTANSGGEEVRWSRIGR